MDTELISNNRVMYGRLFGNDSVLYKMQANHGLFTASAHGMPKNVWVIRGNVTALSKACERLLAHIKDLRSDPESVLAFVKDARLSIAHFPLGDVAAAHQACLVPHGMCLADGYPDISPERAILVHVEYTTKPCSAACGKNNVRCSNGVPGCMQIVGHYTTLHILPHKLPFFRVLSRCEVDEILMESIRNADILSLLRVFRVVDEPDQEKRLARMYFDKTQPSLRICDICKAGQAKRCGGCKIVHYCGRECQIAGAPKHKLLCPGLFRVWKFARSIAES